MNLPHQGTTDRTLSLQWLHRSPTRIENPSPYELEIGGGGPGEESKPQAFAAVLQCGLYGSVAVQCRRFKIKASPPPKRCVRGRPPLFAGIAFNQAIRALRRDGDLSVVN